MPVAAAGSANCDGSASARPSRVSSMAGDPASATVGRWPRALAAAPVGWPSAAPGGPSWAAIGGTTVGTGTAPRIDLRAPRRSDASACFSAAGGSGQTRMGGMARVLCSCLVGGSSTPPRRRAGGRARLHRRAGGPASAVTLRRMRRMRRLRRLHGAIHIEVPLPVQWNCPGFCPGFCRFSDTMAHDKSMTDPGQNPGHEPQTRPGATLEPKRGRAPRCRCPAWPPERSRSASRAACPSRTASRGDWPKWVAARQVRVLRADEPTAPRSRG